MDLTPKKTTSGGEEPATAEGFEGPYASGWRCLRCAATIQGPDQYLEQHRAWHAEVG